MGGTLLRARVSSGIFKVGGRAGGSSSAAQCSAVNRNVADETRGREVGGRDGEAVSLRWPEMA